MALEEYVRKRSFDRTPEPAPSTGKTSKPGATPEAPYFCVQRHNASRLHYDVRLEVDGVLKSWAVPKGPTLDPTVKHLAAHVEDHPLEYGGFEGNIPTGNYGAGSVMLWDRGTFELLGDKSAQDQLARGDFKFRLHGEKLHGEFALVLMKGRGKGNEWLLIKKHDDAAVPGWNVEDHAWSVLSGRTQEEIAQGLPAHQQKRRSAGAPDRVWKSSRPARGRRNAVAEAASPQTAPPEKAPARKRAFRAADLPGAVKAPMPEAISPMLATLVTEPPQGDHWLFEIKWDGVRAICFLSGEKIRLVSRNGLATEKQYPELSVLPHYVAAKEAILDGEIAILDKKGVGRFELIQPRIMNSDPGSIAHMARSQPVTYYVFDVLYLDGYDLRKVPLIERKRALEAILTPTTVLRRSEHFPGVGEHLLESAREIGLEGIMAKRDTSLYEPGRSRDWMKIKVLSEQEFLICG
ncbi:MAG TPA: DNA polymerase ligase N-terminal domain-containing protein, partial [Bryobacteraceae bacterium]|nr:DNA polymerase ligase N-terminal domain-containing protein [Bryobacteraceae bacterium]